MSGAGRTPDPAVSLGPAGPFGRAFRVEPVGQRRGLPLGPAVAELLQPGRELPVDLGPVLAGQPGGLPGDHHGPPFARLAGLQRPEGTGQFRAENLRPTHVSLGLVRRAPLRECYLRSDTPLGAIDRDSGGELPGALRCDERRRLPRLRRGER